MSEVGPTDSEPSLLDSIRRLPTAVLAFGAYVLAAGVLGEVYPISRFAMYSSVQPGRSGVPIARVDGQPVPVESLVGWEGCSYALFQQQGDVPSSMLWRADQIRRWIRLHPADGTGGTAHAVELGWGVVDVVDGTPGWVDDTFVSVCTTVAREAP